MDAEALVFAVTRALHLGSALLLAACPFFAAAVWRPAPGDGERHEAFCREDLALLGGLLAVEVLTGAAWLWYVAGSMTDEPSNLPSGADLGLVLTGTRFGLLWMARAGLAAMLAGLLVALAGGKARTAGRLRPAMALAAVLGAALAGSLAFAGHAASGLRWPVAHLAVDMVHLLAGAVWPAGLVPLLLFLTRSRPRGAVREDTDWIVVRRYSACAFAAVVALVASGVLNSWLMLPSWSAFVTSAYGRLLLGKILVVIAMIVLGAFNRYRFLPALPDATPNLMRTVAAECGLAALVIVIVGLMGMTAPGR